MSKVKHPGNKFQRALIEEKKNARKSKKQAKERASKVWLKLTKEHVKEVETEDELERFLTQDAKHWNLH